MQTSIHHNTKAMTNETHYIYRTLIILILSIWPGVRLASQQFNAEIEIIANAGEYDFNVIPVASLGKIGAFVALGNKIIALEDELDKNEIRSFSLPDSVNIEEFFFLNDRIVFKHRSNVIWSTFEGHFDGMCFADDDFHIASATDSTFLIIHPAATSISEFSMANKDIITTYRFKELPLTAGMLGNSMVAITEETLYLVNTKEAITLHQHPLPIKCAAITPMGIFFGTDSALWRLIGVDEIEHIASGSINQIFGSNRMLYVIDQIGNLYRFSYSENNDDTI